MVRTLRHRAGSASAFIFVALCLSLPATARASNPDGPCAITTPAILPGAMVGAPTTVTVTTTGCSAEPFHSFELATGALPPGMAMVPSTTSAVTIIGTPQVAGVYTFSLRAIDANYRIPSKAFVLSVRAPLAFDTPAVATGQTGAAYTQRIRVSGGVDGPYTFSVVEGALPAGLNLNPTTGVIAGTMPAAGGTFRVRVTDAGNHTAERPYSIFASAAQIVTSDASAPVGSVGTPYAFAIASNLAGAGCSVALGALPGGLVLANGGGVSGTPTAAGDYHFAVRCTAGATSVWKSFNIAVNGPGTVGAAPGAVEETAPYEFVFAAAGGVAPYTYSVTAGSLPAGILLDSGTGALYGELPLGVSPAAFTVTATDKTGRTYSQAVTTLIRVLRLQGAATPVPPVRVFTQTSVNPYSLSLGSGAYTYRVIGGSGREAIGIRPFTGEVTSIFQFPGDFVPVVLVTDSIGGAVVFKSTVYRAVGALRISTRSIPNGLVGVAYATTLAVENALGPVTWSVSGNLPPPGFALGSNGDLTGTATTPGLTTFQVTATDATSASDSVDLSLGIGAGAAIATVQLPPGDIGNPYASVLAHTPALTTPIWGVAPASLPAGLTLSTSGALTGTPTTAGSYTFEVTLSDDLVPVDQKTFTLHVAASPSLALTPATSQEATVGIEPQVSLAVTGGRAPFSFTVDVGSLPDGLSIASTLPYRISGRPARAGSWTFTVTAMDADGRTSSVPYTITVRRAPLIGPRPPNPTRTVFYNQAITVTGGRAPYDFAVSPGGDPLPPGLALSSSGILSGMPIAAGSFDVLVSVVDADGRVDEGLMSFVVGDPLTQASPSVLPDGTLLSPYTLPLTIAGGASLASVRVVSGDLPPLLALSDSGVISGTPARAGIFNFTVAARDVDGRVATRAHSLTIPAVLAPQTITFANPGSGFVRGTRVVLAVAASSGLPVTLTSSTPVVCTIAAASATLLSAGTCTIVAEQAGNAAFLAATPVQQSFAVSRISQTITFTNPGPHTTAAAPLALVATASSHLPVTFGSSTPTVCTTSGSVTTLLSPGTCTLVADQGGDQVYDPALTVSQSFAVVLGRPATPTAVTATVDGALVRLSWIPPAGTAADYYLVEVGDAPGRTTLLSKLTRQTVEVGLLPRGDHYLRVRAVNAAGLGAPSPDVWARVTGDGPDAAAPPIGLGASVVGSTVTLAWRPAEIGAAPDGYLLEVGTQRTGAELGGVPLPATSTSLTVPNVPAGVYVLRVRAHNAAGYSPAGPEILLRVGSSPPCSSASPAPIMLTPVVAGPAVAMTWIGSDAASSFVLEAGSVPGASDLFAADIGPVTGVGASVGAGHYAVRVTPQGVCGPGGTSAEQLLTVGGAVPAAPTGLAAATGPAGVTFSWSPTAGPLATHFVVEAGLATGTSLVKFPVGPTPVITVAGIPSGVTFVARVRAVNASGIGAASTEIVVTVP